MASKWEEDLRADFRAAFTATTVGSRQPVATPPVGPCQLLSMWQQMGYEKVSQKYLLLAQAVDDLRTTMRGGYDGLLPIISLDQLADVYDWLNAAGDHFPCLLVLRAACLDVLRFYACPVGPSTARSALHKWLNPDNVEIFPLAHLNSALIEYKIPELGRDHLAKRAKQRAGRAA